jgi:hypothetical protein
MANLSNINNKFLVTTGGDVAIGVTSPGEKLDVGGNIRVRGVSATKQGVIHNSGSYFSLVSTGDTSDTTGARIWLGNNSSANAYYQNASSHYFRDLSSSIKMTLNSSGNIGIGVTPSNTQAITAQITNGLSLFGNNSTPYGFISNNHAWTSPGGDQYLVSNYGASYYKQYEGSHSWATAPSGTAGSTATFTPRMTILQGGNVGIGESVPLKPLHVKAPDAAGNIRLTRAGTSEYKDIGTYYTYTNGNSAGFGTTSAHKTYLTTNTYNALEINSSQEVSLLGFVGADGFALTQDQNTGYSNFSAGGFGILFRETRDNYILGNAYYYKTGGTAGWRAKFSAYGATMISSDSDQLAFQNAPAVASGTNMTFTNRMQILANGNIGIGTDIPSQKLSIATNAITSNPEYIEFQDFGAGSNWAIGMDFGGLQWHTGDGTGIGPHLIAQIKVQNERNGAAAAGALVFSTAPYNTVMSERMRIKSNGIVEIANGVALGGTAAANLLDDYEEGTWTPAVEGSVTAGTATYGSQGGSYTKIGNKVTCWFSITNFAQSGASGSLKITGLPFTCTTTSVVRGCFAGNIRFYNMAFPGDLPVINLNDNTASFIILWSRNNTTWIASSVSNTGNQYIEGYVTYSTA